MLPAFLSHYNGRRSHRGIGNHTPLARLESLVCATSLSPTVMWPIGLVQTYGAANQSGPKRIASAATVKMPIRLKSAACTR